MSDNFIYIFNFNATNKDETEEVPRKLHNLARLTFTKLKRMLESCIITF